MTPFVLSVGNIPAHREVNEDGQHIGQWVTTVEAVSAFAAAEPHAPPPSHDAPKLTALLQNLSQYLVQDEENQTAYLKMPTETPWWIWYGSDVEAMATYLKLLCKADPHGPTAPRLAKYLINNRKHATYWNSTRDTALCIEALTAYISASGENKPDLTVTVSIDDRKLKDIRINSDNFLSFDGTAVLRGAELSSGPHRLQFSRQGAGPLYFNAYLTNFTLLGQRYSLDSWRLGGLGANLCMPSGSWVVGEEPTLSLFASSRDFHSPVVP